LLNWVRHFLHNVLRQFNSSINKIPLWQFVSLQVDIPLLSCRPIYHSVAPVVNVLNILYVVHVNWFTVVNLLTNVQFNLP
jgi:hypothetical protein